MACVCSSIASDSDMSSVPRFSVIIPLGDHRGHAVRCVRGWARDQTFPREHFEIVIGSPAGHPRAELNEIRGLLGPQDRVLVLDRHHDMDLCAKAAESTSGEVLFFTESHCMPEPGTLAIADAVTRANPQWSGFSGRSIPITGNLLSELEAELYGPDIEFGMHEHPWRKVLDQCFVVHRSPYFQAGGFDPAFGHFAEWLLAARLYALGLKVGYAPTVRIHHLYVGDFGEWHRFTADFLQGQMAYLALEPPDPLTTMFDEVGEWLRRHMLRRRVARRVCRMLLRDLRRSIEVGSEDSGRRSLASPRDWHWRLLRSWLVRAAAGHSRALMRGQRRLLATRVALQVDLLTHNRARAGVHLRGCFEAIATVERTRFLRTWAHTLERDRSSRPPLDDALVADSGLWGARQLGEAHSVGFHPAEAVGAEAIRWSEPAAYVELPLAAGRHVITLNLLFPPLASIEPRPRFYLDEQPIPARNVCIQRDFVELRVDVRGSSSPPRLGWVCAAHRAESDRLRGLPVVSLAWARQDDRSLPRITANIPTTSGRPRA